MLAATTVSTGSLALLIMLYLAIWIGLGYWGATIARRHGYNFWLGFAIGFVGGLIGIAVLYLLGSTSRNRGPARANYYDRQRFGPTGEGSQTTAPKPAGRTKVCQQCSNLVEGGTEFCQYCGARVNEATPV